jgi:hypothetical protein
MTATRESDGLRTNVLIPKPHTFAVGKIQFLDANAEMRNAPAEVRLGRWHVEGRIDMALCASELTRWGGVMTNPRCKTPPSLVSPSLPSA